MNLEAEKTRDHYLALGYYVEYVEKGAQGRKYQKSDFMGFADFFCMSPGRFPLAVQSTVRSKEREHFVKIINEPRALLWVVCGFQIHLMSWKIEGDSAEYWLQDIVKADFPSATVEAAIKKAKDTTNFIYLLKGDK